jgi:hypothetical protein
MANDQLSPGLISRAKERAARVAAQKALDRKAEQEALKLARLRQKAAAGTTKPLPTYAERIAAEEAKAACKKAANRRKRQRRRARENAAQAGISEPLKNAAPVSSHINYKAYRKSEEWHLLRKRYAEAYPNCQCLGCDSPQWRMHHVTYERIGAERLADLIPLCDDCHSKVHDYHRKTRTPLIEFRKALADCLGWSPSELDQRLKRYYAL